VHNPVTEAKKKEKKIKAKSDIHHILYVYKKLYTQQEIVKLCQSVSLLLLLLLLLHMATTTWEVGLKNPNGFS
jgi:hypothetical protein